MRLRRVTLIHNPSAGSADHEAADLITRLRSAGLKAEYHSTKHDDYAAALDKPGDFVIAAGGDGTVRKVAKRLVGSGIPLTVLPLGTANNIAKSVGIHGDPHHLITALPSASVTKFDVGLAKGPWGRKYFFESFGTGLLADALFASAREHETKSPAPGDTQGGITAALRTLRRRLKRYDARDVQATLDDDDLSARLILLEALNIRLAGSNLLLAPHAHSADGMLDVVFVSDEKRSEFDEYLRRRLESGKQDPPRLETRRGRELRLVWHGPTVHFDDKVWPKRSRKNRGKAPLELVTVELKRHRLDLLLPEVK